MDFNNLVENRTISVMDLRNGKSINNFKGMFPIRPTSPPTTFIGATSFAPPFIQLQCLQWAMRILCYLTSSQSTGMPSPDVPARQSNGAVGNTSDYLVLFICSVSFCKCYILFTALYILILYHATATKGSPLAKYYQIISIPPGWTGQSVSGGHFICHGGIF